MGGLGSHIPSELMDFQDLIFLAFQSSGVKHVKRLLGPRVGLWNSGPPPEGSWRFLSLLVVVDSNPQPGGNNHRRRAASGKGRGHSLEGYTEGSAGRLSPTVQQVGEIQTQIRSRNQTRSWIQTPPGAAASSASGRSNRPSERKLNGMMTA